MPLDLTSLIAPTTADDFLARCWAQRSLATLASPQRMPELFAAPALQSLPELLRCPARRIRARFRGEDGSRRQIQTGVAEALDIYATGRATIVIDDIRLPVIRTLMDRMAKQLGTPQLGYACHVYVAPPGYRAAMHFDRQEVFIVQIRGQKRWKVAPNCQVRSPTEQYTGNRLRGELARLRPRFPKRMPRRARSTVLRPGGVLFLPRGFWHAGQAITESVALSLTFASKSWVDVLLPRVRERLILREEWRRIAAGLLGPCRRRNAPLRTMDHLLRSLGHELSAVGVRDFLVED